MKNKIFAAWKGRFVEFRVRSFVVLRKGLASETRYPGSLQAAIDRGYGGGGWREKFLDSLANPAYI